MKHTITTLAVALAGAAAILLVTASPSLASNGTAPDTRCQPGADNQIVEGWQLLSLEEYADQLFKVGSAPTYDSALDRATVTYNFCDRNGDNYACVMEQNLPNDSSGSSHWFLIEDNNFPFNGQ
jgi:hypothetical protein